VPTDAPLRGAPRRKRKTATTRGPQGLPTQASSPQRSHPVSKAPTTRGPQGLPIQTASPQRPARKSYDAPRQSAQRVRRHERKAQAVNLRVHGDAPMNTPERRANNKRVDKLVKQERIKFIRDTREPLIDLKKELSGNGLLAHGLQSLAKRVDITPTGSKSGVQSMGIGSIGKSGSAEQIPKRIAQDLINFPAQAVPSVYVPLSGLVQAAQGHPAKIKAFGKEIDKGDPLFNLGAAAVAEITGNHKEASKRYHTAMKAATEHPGFTLLEAYGLKGGAGRGLGRTMRSGALGPKAKGLAATRSGHRTVEGTGLIEDKTYSPDVFTKSAQVSLERFHRSKAANLRKAAKEIERHRSQACGAASPRGQQHRPEHDERAQHPPSRGRDRARLGGDPPDAAGARGQRRPRGDPRHARPQARAASHPQPRGRARASPTVSRRRSR
jgi:hypothetical protein